MSSGRSPKKTAPSSPARQFTDNLLYTEYWFGDGAHVQDEGSGGIFAHSPTSRRP